MGSETRSWPRWLLRRAVAHTVVWVLLSGGLGLLIGLDEANVARYNEAIRSMTDRSQFILITHIKRTMQSVDVLYGVTMQEAGVSKIVSVRVNETGATTAAVPTPKTKAPPAPAAVA